MENQFTVSIRRQGRAIVLALGGELDLASYPELERAIDRALEPPPELVVLELRELAFMDVAGLRSLVRSEERLRGLGGRLGLAALRPPIMRLLELTGQQQRLSVFATVDDALAAGPDDLS